MHAVRESCMLAGISLVATVLLGTGTTRVRAQPRLAIAPTALEAFAAQPDAKTAWSKFIGRLEGGTAYALMSAVALESASSTPRTMRGIRIELRHEGLRPSCDLKYVEWAVMCDRELAVAYVDASRLEDLRTAVLNGHAEVHPGHPMGVTNYWSSTGASGLLVFGYGLRDRTLEEFATMVATAEAAIKNAPR